MRKILLPLILLAGMTLVGCGGSGGDSSKYGVELTNKTELQEPWYEGDESRALSITLTPEAHPLKEWTDGNLTITSNNPTSISLTGLSVNALKEGAATITVKYHGKTDSVDLVVLHKQTTQERYGVDHAGTADDPFTNEEACKVARAENYNNEDFYVGGTISSFYHAPGARTDGAVSWYLKPAEGKTEKFEVYKAFKEDGSALTDDDIWVNGYAIAHGKFTVYKDYDQAETTDGSAKFVSCTGNKPQPRQTIQATLAEVLTAGAALADGADSYDYYEFEAYVSVKEGNNYFLTATKGEALVKAKSDADHGARDYYSNAFEIYGGQAAEAKLLKNAQVKVKAVVKNYHGQVENGLALTAEDVTVLKEGEPWVINYQEVTFAEALTAAKALADGATSEGYYKFQGEVTKVDYAWNAEKKNMTFTFKGVGDNSTEPETMKCYYISAEDLTLPEKVAEGAKVTVGGKLQNYVKNSNHTYEVVSGLILEVEAAVVPELTGIELSPKTAEVNLNGKTEAQTVTLKASPVPEKAELGEVTWESSDEKVTVAAGVVTIPVDLVAEDAAAKEITITAKVPQPTRGTPVFYDTAVITVKNDSSGGGQEAKTATFTPAEFSGKGTSGSGSEMSAKVEDITVTISKGFGTTEIRAYAHSALSIKCDGGKINELAFTFSASDKTGGLQTSYTGLDTEEWTVADLASQARFTSIVVTYVLGGSTPVEIPQPQGTFFNSVELSDAGKTALQTTSNIVPLFIVLGENNAVSLSINGVNHPVTFKSYDKTTGELVITHTTFSADLSMTYNPETTDLEKLSTPGSLLKYDGGQSLKGNDKLKYWNCDGTTAELQAQFTRRYNNPWTADTSHEDRIVQDTEHAISGSSAKVRAWDGGRIALAVNDFETKFNGRNVSFWVYNPGSSDISLQCFAYKSTGYSNFISVFDGKKAVAGQWTYISVGFTAADVYAFQIVVPNGTATQLSFDDICLF